MDRRSARRCPPHLVILTLYETAATTAMMHCYGSTLRGERCRVAFPHGYWMAAIVTAALRTSSVVATTLFDGTSNSKRFRAYLADTQISVLKRGDSPVQRQPAG